MRMSIAGTTSSILIHPCKAASTTRCVSRSVGPQSAAATSHWARTGSAPAGGRMRLVMTGQVPSTGPPTLSLAMRQGRTTATSSISTHATTMCSPGPTFWIQLVLSLRLCSPRTISLWNTLRRKVHKPALSRASAWISVLWKARGWPRRHRLKVLCSSVLAPTPKRKTVSALRLQSLESAAVSERSA